MLGQRRRRWLNIKSTLAPCIVIAEYMRKQDVRNSHVRAQSTIDRQGHVINLTTGALVC